MKRKPSMGKLTTSELRAAGHVELADHLSARFKSRCSKHKHYQPFQFRKDLPRERKFIPTPQ